MARYETSGRCHYVVSDEGERTQLSNFEAIITEEIRVTDGLNTETFLRVSGRQTADADEEVTLPETTIKASEFPGMAWVLRDWGVRAVIFTEARAKEELRAAIQLASKPKVRTIYRHTGWTEIDGKKTYLHAKGAITQDGPIQSASVELPKELENYDLTPKATEKQGAEAMLSLLEIGPKSTMWPLLATTFTPILGPVDFAFHLTGRTGTYKSELVSLFQSFYGPEMDARKLPGSWSSTANALEALAYLAKDAAFVIDDFVPQGSTWQVRAYQATAERLIRSQGNQAGRTRLTDTASVQGTMYPRGVIISTGEDTPEGHSVRGRMLIVEISPGEVNLKRLTASQRRRHALSAAMTSWVQWVAKNDPKWEARAEEARDRYLDIGHARTPAMVGRLMATIDQWANWLADRKLVQPAKLEGLHSEALDAILQAATGQKSHLEASDPCEIFLLTVRNILAAGLGHVRTRSGGIPKGATALGWTQERGQEDILPTYKSHGPTIGWIDWQKGEFYLDQTGGLTLVKKVAGAEMPLSRQTMVKRLKDSGFLSRCDEQRERNTVRIQAEGHSRQVLAMSIAQVLDNQEVPE